MTNPNCSAIGLVHGAGSAATRFGLEKVMVVTMQAVSGAGYPGVASLDILGNVIPYISKEEEKMEEETRKLLGALNGSRIVPAPFAMSAQCNRVAVEDGHTESVSVKLKKKARPEEMIEAWNEFRAVPQEMRLPSAPEQPVHYMTAARPSPAPLRRGPRRGHDGERRPAASLRRAGLEVHRAVAQYHSRRRRRGPAERRIAEGAGISRDKLLRSQIMGHGSGQALALHLGFHLCSEREDSSSLRLKPRPALLSATLSVLNLNLFSDRKSDSPPRTSFAF